MTKTSKIKKYNIYIKKSNKFLKEVKTCHLV